MSLRLPPTSNDDQENIFSPSSNGRGNGRGTASARAWEERLDDVVSLADESIEKFRQMQKPKPRSTAHANKTLPLAVGTRARSASTSRATTPIPIPDKESENSSTTLDIKVDFLFRRTKMLDEKLRHAEKEKLESKTLSQEARIMVQHLTESIKADQKQISAMNENIVSLRGTVEVLSFREKELTALIDSKSNHVTPAKFEAIVEAVTIAVKGNFRTLIEETRKNSAAEHAKLLSRLTEKASIESEMARTENRRCEMEIIPAVEKEVERMIVDFSRLKGRQDSLEGNYHALQNAVNLREKRAVESHRRAISACKQDMATVMDTVGRRVNDLLSINAKSMTIAELSDIVEKQTDRLKTHDAQNRDLSAQLKTCSTLSYDAILLARELQTEINIKTSNSIDNCAIAQAKNDSMAPDKSIISSLHDLKTEIRDVKCTCTEYQIKSITKLESLSASHSRTKAKINELSAGIASISKIREAVESLLSEVTVKPPNCTQDSDQLNISINSLDCRLKKLEALSHYFPNVDDSPESPSPRSEPKGPGDDTSCLSLQPLLEEMLEKKISGLQSELEDAVRSGWADVINRNTSVAEEGLKLGEVVQRLQGVVMNIQVDQKSISESVAILKQRFQNDDLALKAEVPDVNDERTKLSVPINVPTVISRIPMKPSLSDSVLFASPLKARPVRSNRYPDPESPQSQSLLASPGEYVDVHSRGWPIQFPSLSSASAAVSHNARREEGMEVAKISPKGTAIEQGGAGGGEEENMDKVEENVRMSIRMLASLTDCVYMNAGTDIPYQPLMALDISTFSAVKPVSSMSSREAEGVAEVEGIASTSPEIGRSSDQLSGNRSEGYLRESSPHTVDDVDSSVHGRDSVDDCTSHFVRASHDIDKDDLEALRRSVSLDEHIDPDESQRLHMKKNQHRSQFLKMVMSKK